MSQHNQSKNGGGSLLFQPHRTLGLLCTASPFSFSPGSNSLDSFITVPQQERFVIYRCDSLRPVLVSEALPSSATSNEKIHESYTFNNRKNQGKKKRLEEFMYHAITDTSLSITVAAHGNNVSARATHASLYKRTKVVHSLPIVRKSVQGTRVSHGWGITQVVSLGRSKLNTDAGGMDSDHEEDEEQGNSGPNENGLILAFICSRTLKTDRIQVENDVHVVGESSDESSSDDESESSEYSMNEIDESPELGEVVIVIASRTKLRIEKRIPLTSLSHFYPTYGIHPMTYLNKILLGSRDGGLILLNIRSGKIIHEFTCLRLPSSTDRNQVYPFCITSMTQSPVVDTIAVGTREGKVHLINLRKDVNLFTLSHYAPKKKGHEPSEVRCNDVTSISFRTDGTALEYGIAPMAVGLKNGTISVWDLSPKEPTNEAGTTLSKDSSIGTTRTLLCQMENVHKGGVSKLLFFPQEPLLISAGTSSNTIFMHVFDNPNHSGRILRHRQGHCSPPVKLRYIYPSTGGILASMADGTDASACQILSCGGVGDCTVRSFSTARSVLDREFSQGKGITKKARQLGLDDKVELLLNPVIDFATCQARTRDWGDLVTIHKDHPFAYVWSTKRHAQSGPVLRQDDWEISDMKKKPPRSENATSVALSICGNFALVGTRGGKIYKYNVQSGLPRGSYPKVDKAKDHSKKGRMAGDIERTMKIIERDMKMVPKPVTEKSKMDLGTLQNMNKKMHDGYSVTGLAIDSLNKLLISVGADSKLIVWFFKTHIAKNQVLLQSPATILSQLRDSDLLAIAMQNFSIILFDYSSLTIVRRFGGELSSARHYGPITDMAFGPDGRKLYSSSYDGTIRVWDVPTSSCIDWMAFKSAPTALALSPTGEFLATTHSDRLGLSIWCDRSFYQTIHSGGSLALEKPYFMDEPATVAESLIDDDEDLINIRRDDNIGFNQHVDVLGSTSDVNIEESNQNPPVPKQHGLVTLSTLPVAHWKNLFQLELIKERNKPTEPPKKPPSAPFFLQWRSGEKLNEPANTAEDGEKNAPIAAAETEDEWPSAWSENDDVDKNIGTRNESEIISADHNDDLVDNEKKRKQATNGTLSIKKSKTAYYRSHLASLLEECAEKPAMMGTPKFDKVSQYISTLGPSAIDVSLSSLCYGLHDLHDGLYFLHLASSWLLESISSRQMYECVNAYLNRFLYIHGPVIAGIEDSTIFETSDTQRASLTLCDTEIHERRIKLLQILKDLKLAQKSSSEDLRCKMQRSYRPPDDRIEQKPMHTKLWAQMNEITTDYIGHLLIIDRVVT